MVAVVEAAARSLGGLAEADDPPAPPAKQSETCAGRCGPPLDTGLASCPERPLTTPDLLSVNGAYRPRVPAAGQPSYRLTCLLARRTLATGRAR